MTNSSDRSELRGFISSCWHFRDKIVWSWDFAAFLVVVGVATFGLTDAQINGLAEPLASASVALGGALVGVVVAGLAVVVALLDDELLDLMESDTKSGHVAGHLFPYWFVTATGVGALLLGLLLRITSDLLPDWALRALFVAVSGLLVWTALGVLNLVGSLNQLGINRALLARLRRARRD